MNFELRTIAQRYLLPSLPLDPKGRLTLQEGRGRGLCGSRFKVRGSRFMLALLTIFNFQFSIFNLTSCAPEPPLHLYDAQDITITIPGPKLELNVIWNYEIAYKVKYDWMAEWYYGWDDGDRSKWGEMGYTEPTKFYIRRYYTGDVQYGPHLRVDKPAPIYGNIYEDYFDFGFWDLLVYNEPQVNVLSVHFDESDPEHVLAYTKASPYSSRFHAPRYTRAFYAPEPLFSAYEQGFEINRDLRGFVFDEERNVYVRQIPVTLLPVTYIYLTQIILHNNKGRVTGVDGVSSLSGMAINTCLQNRRAGDDAISVSYECKMKTNVPYITYDKNPTDAEIAAAEKVDVVGGRLMTFGICGFSPYDLTEEDLKNTDFDDPAQVNKLIKDPNEHYIEVTFQFANGSTTMALPVTDQVRKHYKGGVLTIELNVDDIPVPDTSGGSGFNAVVAEAEEETHEIEFDIDKNQ